MAGKGLNAFPKALEELMGISLKDMMKQVGAAEDSIDDLDETVQDEPKRQPHLISFSDFPAMLEENWKKTNTVGPKTEISFFSRAFQRKSLVHAYKEIRESPYDPKSWVGRAMTLSGLGYSELAVADAYRAWLLTGALMNAEAAVADKGKLFGRVYAAMAKHVPQEENQSKKLKMEAIGEVLWEYRNQAVLAMVLGLKSIRAWDDVTHILEDALEESPDNDVFAHLLAESRKDMKELKRVFKIEGMNEKTLAKAVKRGRVNRVAYPWIVPGELARSTNAVKRLKAKFKEASSNAVVAASSVGGISKDNYGVFAKDDIRKGQRILLDKTIFCDYNIPGGDHCGACCDSLVAGGVGMSCCQMKYCSEDCKNKALSNYHKTICDGDFTWLYDDCKDADFNFNDTIPLVMLKVLAAAVQQNVKPLSLPCVATLTANYDSDKVSFFRLQHNVTTPIRILQTLGVDVFADPRFDSWVIQTLFLRIENNMGGSTFGKRSSISISPYFSMFNHDCDPSAKWGSKNELLDVGGPVVVTALRDIKANEEIKVSYVERYLPEKQRREKLRIQLGMICNCERCLRGRAGEKETERDVMDMMMEEHAPAEMKKAFETMGLSTDATKKPDLTKLMGLMGLDPADLAGMMNTMGLGAASGSKPDLASMMKMLSPGLGSGPPPDMTKMMEKMGSNQALGKKRT